MRQPVEKGGKEKSRKESRSGSDPAKAGEKPDSKEKVRKEENSKEESQTSQKAIKDKARVTGLIL